MCKCQLSTSNKKILKLLNIVKNKTKIEITQYKEAKSQKQNQNYSFPNFRCKIELYVIETST